MVLPEGTERVLAAIEPADTLIDKHADADAIRTLLIDWAREPESKRQPFTHLVTDIVDRYAQDGSLGVNPAGTLRYYLETHVADKLHLAGAWMVQGALKAGADLNLLRQHYGTLQDVDKTLARIDKALDRAEARMEGSEEGEGTGNYVSLLERKEAALQQRETILKTILDLQLTTGVLEDRRIQKSAVLHKHEHEVSAAAAEVMGRTRGKAPIDVDPVRKG